MGLQWLIIIHVSFVEDRNQRKVALLCAFNTTSSGLGFEKGSAAVNILLSAYGKPNDAITDLRRLIGGCESSITPPPLDVSSWEPSRACANDEGGARKFCFGLAGIVSSIADSETTGSDFF